MKPEDVDGNVLWLYIASRVECDWTIFCVLCEKNEGMPWGVCDLNGKKIACFPSKKPLYRRFCSGTSICELRVKKQNKDIEIPSKIQNKRVSNTE